MTCPALWVRNKSDINERFMYDLLKATQFVQFCTPPDSEGKHVGDTARWLQFPEWTNDSTLILSQTDPMDNQIAISGTAGTLNTDKLMSPHGGFVEVSTFALDTMPVGTMDRLAKRCADAAQAGLDSLALTALSGVSTTRRFVGTASIASGIGSGTLTAGQTIRAKMFAYCQADLDDKGNSGFDHLGGYYGAVIHPLAAAQLMAEAKQSTGEVVWSDVNKHVAGKQEKIEKGDAGALFNIRIFKSPYIDDSATINSVSAYVNYVLGRDALGCSSIKQADGTAMAVVKIKQPGPQSTNDPLDTQNTIGWKWTGCFALLDTNRLIQLVTSKA